MTNEKINEELITALLSQIGELNDPVEGETEEQARMKINKANAVSNLATRITEHQRLTIEAAKVELQRQQQMVHAWELADENQTVYTALKTNNMLGIEQK